jgi:hypothetical protein
MKNTPFLRIALIMMMGLLVSGPQNRLFAHFLFLRVGEHAEAGRAAEVFFSERAAAGDPRFITKIAGTQLWLQQQPGQIQPLSVQRGTDRLRAHLPSSGAVSVTGICEYGILEREVPFLLRYYPKGISGPITEVNAFKPNEKLTLEIVASVTSDAITLSLLDHGKPVPNATFTTVDDDLVNEELRADEHGYVTWKPSGRGHYCIYTKVTRKESGEHNGKKYTEIREFPTIGFEWPMGRTDADNDAVELFEKAVASRASWQKFPGFTAKIEGEYDGRPFSGTTTIDPSGSVELKIDQEVAASWVEDQLKSLVMHRIESPKRAAPVVRFADQDTSNPLGRLVIFAGGRFASSYRIKDGQLKTVNRNLDKENMTITVLENEKTPEGKFLPRFYTVQYWNAGDGQLLRTETFENRWVRKGTMDLPSTNNLITSSASGISVRGFRLSDHELRN